MVLDTNENYLKTQSKHVGGWRDKEVDIEELGASDET